MATKKIENTEQAWDDRLLGATEEFVAVAGPEHRSALDDALGMTSISLRVPKKLVDQYKLIAHFHGVGYQPLMRDIMTRYVPGALTEILQAEQAKAEQMAEELPPMRKAA